MIRLSHCTVEWTEWGCWTAFPDGTGFGAHPHDTHHYHVPAHRLGYGDDILRYAREHEVMHSFVSEFLHRSHSYVLWQLAHGLEVDVAKAVYEEAMVMTCQRWIRANERPIIGGVDWDAMKREAIALLGE